MVGIEGVQEAVAQMQARYAGVCFEASNAETAVQAADVEAGDLLMAAPGVADWSTVSELGDVIANGVAETRSQADITVFKSLGIALADVALGELVTRRAMAVADLGG